MSKARVPSAPRDSGMGSILAYANAGKYRDDTTRTGGVTGKLTHFVPSADAKAWVD